MRTVVAFLAMAVVASACGGDDPASPTVLSVAVTASKQTIAVGERVQLTATARDVNGVTVPGATFTYATSAAGVLNVASDGRVIGLTLGSASITATSGGQTSPPLAITVTASATAAAAVTMTPQNTFVPPSVTIKVNQSVLFVFPAVAHNVTFQAASGLQTIPATSNADVPRAFPTAGTFPYVCTIHPGMSGQVVVTP